MIPKPPWSKRKDRKSIEEFYALREGIPGGLKNSLMDFAARYFVSGSQVRVERTEHLARLIGRALPREWPELLNMFWQDDDLLLDAIDHALQYPWKGRSYLDAASLLGDYPPSPKSAALELKSYLDDARSVYDVFPIGNREHDDQNLPKRTRGVSISGNDDVSPVRGDEHELGEFAIQDELDELALAAMRRDKHELDELSVRAIQAPVRGDEYRLGYRQPQEIRELAEDAISDRSRASEHLRRAWLSAFSREADLNAACIEAVKAIESAARGIIEPNNSRATLGSMIRAMESKPTKWQTDLGSSGSEDLKTIIGMMKMVWKGHPRHGNPDDLIDVSLERCEMIVHSAALLVHWFLSGRVRQT